MNKRVVYTVLIGPNHKLLPHPRVSNVDWICLTDQPIEDRGWVTRQIDVPFTGDSPRSSRKAKILTHQYLPEYEQSLYVDTKVRLNRDPNEMFDWLDHNTFVAFYHELRSTLIEEFKIILECKIDRSDSVYAGLRHILDSCPELLMQRPVWGGLLLRNHNDRECIARMELWWNLVCQFSRRDQLSLLSIIQDWNKAGLKQISNTSSKFHEWPILA